MTRTWTLRQRLHDDVSYEYGDLVTHFSTCFHQRDAESARSHFLLFYQRKLIMHVECGRAILARTRSSARCAVENATLC